MEHPIVQYLSKYITLTDEQAQAIARESLVKTYEKGTILLRKGAVSKNCFFVLKGCVRSYYLIDGEEKITEFYTEHQPINPVSYTTGEPSEYYLACVEDAVLSLGDPQKTQELFEKIPQMKSVGLIISSELLAENQISFDSYKNLSPEERYFKLLETRPDLCQRVPQYMLASYLGIKPESLSRIRRRIHQQKR